MEWQVPDMDYGGAVGICSWGHCLCRYPEIVAVSIRRSFVVSSVWFLTGILCGSSVI